MRARFAYISSLGTTAILVAAALLMLVVVGAIVAFRGWPGTANGESIQPVPLAPRASATGTLKAKRPAPVRRVARSRPARRPAARKRSLSTAGLVKIPDSGRSNLVPGLVLVPTPTATAPPAVAPPAPVTQSVPGTASTPSPPRAPGAPDPAPLPDPADVLPVSLPDPGVPALPGVDEVETMVGGVVSGGPPLPGVDVGDVHVHVPLGLGR